MRRVIWVVIKLGIASLLAGWLLGLLGITSESILKAASLSQQDVTDFLVRAEAWVIPRVTLGAIIIIPAWLITYLFMPAAGD